MLIEYLEDQKLGFAYNLNSLDEINTMTKMNATITRTENIQGVTVNSIIFEEQNFQPQNANLLNIKCLKCMHGNDISYKTTNRLPHEGWEELIDSWSCHCNEFKGMLDLKIKPRENGILVSNFYCIIHKNSLPNCCQNSEKLFYNDLHINFSDQKLIYIFFEEFFNTKNKLILSNGDKNYEIKYFYKCLVFDPECLYALKVGIKESPRSANDNKFLNVYYTNKILEIISDNFINISIHGYRCSFIKCSD